MPAHGQAEHAAVLAAAEALCQAWQPYTAVICCTDRYPVDLAAAPYRAKVTDLQTDAAHALTAALVAARYPLLTLCPAA